MINVRGSRNTQLLKSLLTHIAPSFKARKYLQKINILTYILLKTSILPFWNLATEVYLQNLGLKINFKAQIAFKALLDLDKSKPNSAKARPRNLWEFRQSDLQVLDSSIKTEL